MYNPHQHTQDDMYNSHQQKQEDMYSHQQKQDEMYTSYPYSPATMYSDSETIYSNTPYANTPTILKPLPTPVEPGEESMLWSHDYSDYSNSSSSSNSNSNSSWASPSNSDSDSPPVASTSSSSSSSLSPPAPQSHSQSPPTAASASGYNDDVISISTSFHPSTTPAPDTIFASSDNVFFYAIHTTILSAAPSAFAPCLPSPRGLADPACRTSVIMLDAPAAELNIILHALYGTSPASNDPTFECLVKAIDKMPRYGLSPEHLITPHTPLYTLLLAHAPLYPLDSYALAAHHRIAALARTVSSHLLSHDLMMVSDEMAERIGPVYLKRLLLLHSARFEALKGILLRAPEPHGETRACGFEQQKKVTRAWALVAAYLAWDARPDISTQTLSNTLNPLLEHLTCKSCEKALQNKIQDVMVRWMSVKDAALGFDGWNTMDANTRDGLLNYVSGGVVMRDAISRVIPYVWSFGRSCAATGVVRVDASGDGDVGC